MYVNACVKSNGTLSQLCATGLISPDKSTKQSIDSNTQCAVGDSAANTTGSIIKSNEGNSTIATPGLVIHTCN